ncbi:MAG: FAD-binding oxidoreductase [Dehalococcoidia bacterium]|nr:FAD-binding oxidoreductase [Dehalococcoidia bacterium]
MVMKWWGWGDEEKSFPLADADKFWAFAEQRLGKSNPRPRLRSLDDATLPPSRLDPSSLSALQKAAGDAPLRVDVPARAVHSVGKGYCDLVRIRSGTVDPATDAVIYPESEDAVARILETAAERSISVVPFGGGTTVVGGLDPVGERPVVTLALYRLDRVLAIDPVSATATVEAGILGPALEAELGKAGFTLGHFPQSFEYSSLGGWIATRSAGQKSTLYGKIEERVQSLRMLFPGGAFTTADVPAAAAGPDFAQVITGSEGVLGVITRATMRLAPAPPRSEYHGYLLPSFAEGVEAARRVMQAGLKPAVMRLSDEAETEATAVMRAGAEGIAASILIMGFDGEEDDIRAWRQSAERILEKHGARSLGPGLGEAWERSRFELPYLRDLLLDHGIMVDTLETATTWDRYLPLYQAVRTAMEQALGGRGIVMAHLSHAYTNGASIYYTFLAAQEEGNEIEQWRRLKRAATQAIVDNGGALSHHHGVGTEHRPWVPAYLGEGVRALDALKNAFDSKGIMNPGKLLPESKERANVRSGP